MKQTFLNVQQYFVTEKLAENSNALKTSSKTSNVYVFVSITIHIRTLFWKQMFFAWHGLSDGGNGILFPKLFWPTVRKNCSSDWEKLLKLEAKGREFEIFLRSLEQFIRERSEQLLGTECLFLEVSHI